MADIHMPEYAEICIDTGLWYENILFSGLIASMNIKQSMARCRFAKGASRWGAMFLWGNPCGFGSGSFSSSHFVTNKG